MADYDGCLTALIFISKMELPEEKSSPERDTSHKEHVIVVPLRMSCIREEVEDFQIGWQAPE